MKSLMVISILCISFLSACDSLQQEQQVRSLESEVKQLKADVAELKQSREQQRQEHHYELRTQGFRTWRFDPATGETCIQLTSSSDWKNKETMSQSCVCSDATDRYFKMPQDTEPQQKAANLYYDAFVKKNCGE